MQTEGGVLSVPSKVLNTMGGVEASSLVAGASGSAPQSEAQIASPGEQGPSPSCLLASVTGPLC